MSGKNSVINIIIDNPFIDRYKVSIGIEFMSKNIKDLEVNIKNINMRFIRQEKNIILSYFNIFLFISFN